MFVILITANLYIVLLIVVINLKMTEEKIKLKEYISFEI